ncbi:MAG: hypothetical protein H6810_01240 [Phycisphaeraceae bacterium]|nr:MAG: hypothetical protein H6810_01240 [Phycisphaeraceae bacterium]
MRTSRYLLAAFVAAAASLAGCNSLNTMKPGGRGASLDQFTYVSETYSPKTVSLVDTRSQEEIWSMDVPVGQKLIIRFYTNKTKDNIDFPDVMRWDMIPATQLGTLLDNSMPVPDRWSRRVEMEIREAPEYPPETLPVATDIMPGGGPVPPADPAPGNG